MRRRIIGYSLLVWIIAVGVIPRTVAGEKGAGAEDRIGIYDSRAIAVAFVGSEVYKETAGKVLEERMAARKKAKENGDQERVDELEKWGKAQQARLHKQAFSGAPVDDILAHIPKKVAVIKKGAKVTAIISKWDKKALAEHEGAERLDVTLKLVDAFKPTAKQRKSAVEIQKSEPVR